MLPLIKAGLDLAVMKNIYGSYPDEKKSTLYSCIYYEFGVFLVICVFDTRPQIIFILALVCLLIRLIQKYTCIQTQVSLFNGVFLFQIDLEKCTRNGSTWCGNRWWKRYKFVCTITLVWNYCVLVNEVD